MLLGLWRLGLAVHIANLLSSLLSQDMASAIPNYSQFLGSVDLGLELETVKKPPKVIEQTMKIDASLLMLNTQ